MPGCQGSSEGSSSADRILGSLSRTCQSTCQSRAQAGRAAGFSQAAPITWALGSMHPSRPASLSRAPTLGPLGAHLGQETPQEFLFCVCKGTLLIRVAERVAETEQ